MTLTCCLRKTVERMVKSRLIWYLENNNILNELQSGFRRGQSTADQLVRLENFIHEAFVRGEHASVVFLLTWKKCMTLRGNMVHCKIYKMRDLEATCQRLSLSSFRTVNSTSALFPTSLILKNQKWVAFFWLLSL
jgi:hypothetical protein